MAGPLEQFFGDDRDVVVTLLEYVFRHGGYRNEIHFLSGDDKVRLFVQPKDEGGSGHEEISTSMTLLHRLDQMGLISIVPPNAPRTDRQGRVQTPQANTFAFLTAAFHALNALEKVDENAIRQRLGQHFLNRYNEAPDEYEDFDANTVAERISVDVRLVREQTRLLRDLGLLEDASPINSSIDLGLLSLSRPAGLHWAAAGFPSISLGTTVHNVVNIDLHVSVNSVIHQARQADVDPELLLKWEGLLRRLEEELEKPEGQGSFQTAKDVIETAAASRGLLEPTIRFFNDRWDRIQGLAEGASGAIGSLLD